jgi:AcrR family transcriptional regulator
MGVMADVKPRGRTYRSEHRARQAASTRLAILDAARRLYPERGYAGTTVAAIAAAAGVAAITVYSTFGSKRALLQQLIHIAITGDEDPAPIIQRDEPRAVMALTDQRAQIGAFAESIAGMMERVAPLLAVLADASRTEPDMLGQYNDTLRERRRSMREVAVAIARNGPLREGESVDRAADTIWALTSAEMMLLFTQRLGWTRQQYAGWLAESLTALLLPPQLRM